MTYWNNSFNRYESLATIDFAGACTHTYIQIENAFRSETEKQKKIIQTFLIVTS